MTNSDYLNLKRIALKLCGNKEQAEDLVHASWVASCDYFKDKTVDYNVYGFMVTYMRNEFYRFKIKAKRTITANNKIKAAAAHPCNDAVHELQASDIVKSYEVLNTKQKSIFNHSLLNEDTSISDRARDYGMSIKNYAYHLKNIKKIVNTTYFESKPYVKEYSGPVRQKGPRAEYNKSYYEKKKLGMTDDKR